MGLTSSRLAVKGSDRARPRLRTNALRSAIEFMMELTDQKERSVSRRPCLEFL